MSGSRSQRKERTKIREQAILVKNDLNTDELNNIMESSDPQLLVKKMEMVQLDQLLDIEAKAKSRNEATRKIEQEMIELYQLYISFNLLVMTQKAKFDTIREAIEKTENYAERARKNIAEADASQRRANKFVIITVVIVAVILTTVYLAIHFGSK